MSDEMRTKLQKEVLKKLIGAYVMKVIGEDSNYGKKNAKIVM